MDHWYVGSISTSFIHARGHETETPADMLESEFSFSNFAKEFFLRNQKKYEVKSLALFRMCVRELLIKFKYYIGSI